VKRKKFRVPLILILLFTAAILTMPPHVYTQPIPIGQTPQPNPFESNPTANAVSGLTVTNPAFAYDGQLGTPADFSYGEADGTYEVNTFDSVPPTSFTISWVDIKVSYKAEATTASDDRYRIVYYVDPDPTPIVLQDWVNGSDLDGDTLPDAKIDPVSGAQVNRAWSNQAEPNDGAWSWTDIGNVRIVVETDQVTDNDTQRIYIYEVWLSVYSGPLPPDETALSVQPSVVSGSVGTPFFVDVYVTDVTMMWGYQFIVNFDPAFIFAIDYFSYHPFNLVQPSQINPDNVTIVRGTWFGDPIGFTGSTPVARIYFVPTLGGTVLLDLHGPFDGSELPDVNGIKIAHVDVDGAFTTINHDVAVTDVTPDQTEVNMTDIVSIDVTAENQGENTETFTVTAYANDIEIDTQTVNNLASGATDTLTFTWDTTLGVSAGVYTIKAVAETLLGEVDTADNEFTDGTVTISEDPNAPRPSFTYSYEREPGPSEGEPITFTSTSTDADGLIVSWEWDFGDPNNSTPGTSEVVTHAYSAPGTYTVILTVTDNDTKTRSTMRDVDVYRHDVAVVTVTPPSPPWVGKNATIIVEVKNEGNFTETFTVTLKHDNPDTEIGTQTVTDLASDDSKPLTFKWNTTDVAQKLREPPVEPQDFTVTAEASAHAWETDIVDNTNSTIVTLNPVHDLAVTSVTFSPIEVEMGEPVDISVNVTNLGSFSETFDVRASHEDPPASGEWKLIGRENDVSLSAGESRIMPFTWDTADVSPGIYRISAGEVKPGDWADNVTENNRRNAQDSVTVGAEHNIKVEEVTASSFKVTPGEEVIINVKVRNTGRNNETFTVTVRANGTQFDTQTVTLLSGAFNDTLTFTWGTTGASLGTYNITVEAIPVENETYIADNMKSLTVTVGIHDLAVTSVTASPTEVEVGDLVTINVTVANQGIFTEQAFNVTVYANDTEIGTQNVTLTSGTSATLTFNWTTTGVSRDVYVIKAVAANVTGENKTDNNLFVDGEVAVGVHDLAVTSVTASPTEVEVGDLVTINVTVANQGYFTETTFTVTVRYDGTEIGTRIVPDLAKGASTTLSFDWTTGDVSPNTYTIEAEASQVAGETDTTNNIGASDPVTVKAQGLPLDIFLYAAAGIAIIGVGAGISVYFLKIRKPKSK